MSKQNLTIKVNCAWTTDRFNKSNSALYFYHGYAQAPPGVYFDPATGGFTIMLWIKLISVKLTTWARILDFSANGGYSDGCYLYFTIKTANPGFVLFNSTTKTTDNTFTGNLTLSIWTHLAVSVTGSTGTYYINGVSNRIIAGK